MSPAPAMRRIPAGTTVLRDARTGTAREVTLEEFSLSQTAVTHEQWRAVLDSSSLPATSPLSPAHPVTWFDAVRWCNAASRRAGMRCAYAVDGRDVVWDVGADGFRLPTEAEWEWACRAGTSGPTYGALSEIAWTAADHAGGPQDVGRKKANAFGLFDMIGNVWEWCWDYADPARYGEYRSLRGGGWADEAWSCRAGVRRGSAPDAVLEDVGFRVARGAAGDVGVAAAQGWSEASDHERATLRGPLPMGWTPLHRPPRS